VKLRLPWILISLLVGQSLWLHGQDTLKILPDGTQGEVQPTKDSIAHIPKKKRLFQFDLGFTTLKVGAGFLYEFAGYSQDKESKIQADSGGYSLESAFKVRDFRILASGKFNTKRTITWRVGFMYDGPTDSWFLRESGVMIDVPELYGNLFIGRTKEGYSLNKVMNGYSGWTMERHMSIDVIPILADGIKWLGYFPKKRIFWNLGAFTDWLSKGQSFSTYEWQLAARVGWLPIYSPADKSLLHLGINLRTGKPVDGQIRLRSRPEANPAPYFIDTKTFDAENSNHFGWEAYYTKGKLMLGTEYNFHKFYSVKNQNPLFHGGDVVVSYMLTGESRPYSTITSIYGFVPVSKPVFKGGYGAVELVLRYSQLNLDDGPIKGGKFWRITPMVNWYLNRIVRLEFAYGYGTLDRYNLKGVTQFFQSRLQFAIL
jgi:phosphate-selective porin OprO/OprP